MSCAPCAGRIDANSGYGSDPSDDELQQQKITREDEGHCPSSLSDWGFDLREAPSVLSQIVG